MCTFPKIVLILFDLIIFAIFVPPISLIACILYIYKSIITIIAQLADPTLSALEETTDTITSIEPLKESENVKNNIGIIIRVEGKVEINWLRDKFNASFLAKDGEKNYYRYLTTFVEYGGYTFRKFLPLITVDMSLQIVESEVPENMNLNEFIRTWFNQPYKSNQPAWGIMLLNTREETNISFLICKMHHIIGDGYTIVNLLETLTDSKTPYIVKGFNETFLDKFALLVKSPRVLFKYFRDVMKVLQDIPLPVTLPEENNIPAFHTTMTLDLQDLISIRKKTGVNFQSIGLGLLGGLARRIALKEIGVDKNRKIQDSTYILFSLPWPNHPYPKMANHWTLGHFKVPLRNMSAYERLIEVDQNYKLLFDNEIHKILYRYCFPILALFPIRVTRRMLVGNRGQQLLYSSVPGSPEKLYIDGHLIKTIHPMMAKQSANLGIISCCFSHSGLFNVTLIGAKSVIESQERADKLLQKYFLEELQELNASIPFRIEL